MSKLLHLGIVFVLLAGSLLQALPARAAQADASESLCVDGVQASGAVYRICMPTGLPWNGDLVVYAHGYVAFNEPVGIPEDQLVLPDGTSIPEIVNGLGFAFATTSYSTNGLAVLQGVADVVDLVNLFRAANPQTDNVYLVGASEGGLVTTLAVEQNPAVFSGGLAVCGPIGDFQRQINYWGDFRVVFDYFFPNVLPPSAVSIPDEVIANWETVYQPAVAAAIQANPSATRQLLSVTGAPVDIFDPATTLETVDGLLWYNVFATNDGVAKLGGQPFDNKSRWYRGSSNDLRLNLKVKRFTADPAAAAEISAHYQTSGVLLSPLVTLHTTGDPIVPYWHATQYRSKAWANGSFWQHSHIPVLRYGHCNFTPVEVLVGFGVLVIKAGRPELAAVERVLKDPAQLEEYYRLLDQYSAASEK